MEIANNRTFLLSESGKNATYFYNAFVSIKFHLFSLFLLFIGTLSSYSQTTIVVNKLPANTPSSDSIFIAGSFNDWNPADTKYILQKQPNGSYAITVPITKESFQFKFTRGSWAKVEGTMDGQQIPNRLFVIEPNKENLIPTEIKGWEDLPAAMNITFLVTKIPNNTPHDATIYVAGNFNNWNPSDDYYRLVLQPDSTYKLTIPCSLDSLVFKFTRGSWSSVECRANGKLTYNHLYERKDASPALVQAEIEAWEDLISGNSSIYLLILLMATFQGVFLMVAINGIKNRNKEANAILSCLILLLIVSYSGKMASFERAIFNFQPKIYLLSDSVYFLFGPLAYLYFKKLFSVKDSSTGKTWLLFIPFFLQILVYLPLLFTENKSFINSIIDQSYYGYFATISFIALLYNVFYWFRCRRILNEFKEETEEDIFSGGAYISYVNSFLKITALWLQLWASLYLINLLFLHFDVELRLITETGTDILWVAIALFPYLLSYYSIKKQEVFRLEEDESLQGEKQKYASMPLENLDELKEKLSGHMLNQKPYRNPKLSLQELADLMDTNVHTISRLINEGYEKNFYDFINDYRIEEFKNLLISNKYKNHTLLAIALEVGFSSKTTFYRAFKKSTGKTPRQYVELKDKKQMA